MLGNAPFKQLLSRAKQAPLCPPPPTHPWGLHTHPHPTPLTWRCLWSPPTTPCHECPVARCPVLWPPRFSIGSSCCWFCLTSLVPDTTPPSFHVGTCRGRSRQEDWSKCSSVKCCSDVLARVRHGQESSQCTLLGQSPPQLVSEASSLATAPLSPNPPTPGDQVLRPEPTPPGEKTGRLALWQPLLDT